MAFEWWTTVSSTTGNVKILDRIWWEALLTLEFPVLVLGNLGPNG